MSIDAAGTTYWTGHGGVVLVNDPLDTIHEVAVAYDIRWLVLDRGDSVAAVAPILDGTEHPAWLGPPILSDGTPTKLAVYPVLSDRRDPPRGRPDRRSASSSSRSSRASSSPPRSSSRNRRTPPTTSASRGTCSRAAASSPMRCGATRRRRSSSRARRSRSGCRSRRSSPRSRWPSSAHVRGGAVGRRSSSARSCRSSPGGSPPTSPRSAACPTAGPGRWPSGPA